MTLDCCTILTARRSAFVHYCLNLLGSWEDAEDVMQTTALKAWRGWDRQSFESERAAVAWLYRVAHNECLDELRRRGCRPQSAGAFDDLLRAAPLNVERIVCEREAMTAVRTALDGMEPHYADLILRVANGATPAELARIEGGTRGTMKSRVWYAREKLRRQMERAA